jgi:hypothetical protein
MQSCGKSNDSFKERVIFKLYNPINSTDGVSGCMVADVNTGYISDLILCYGKPITGSPIMTRAISFSCMVLQVSQSQLI